MWDDPIVDEIRKNRLKHAKEFNFNLDNIFADLKEKQNNSNREIVSFKDGKYVIINKSDNLAEV